MRKLALHIGCGFFGQNPGVNLVMMRTLHAIFGATLLLLTGGCSNLLPTVEEETESQWQSYADAKQSFDKIVPNETTESELQALGFDPFANANIELLNYLDIIERFMPNQSIRLEDLHPDIQSCLEAKTECRGYEAMPQRANSERYGNALLDVFNFRRKTRTTGWKFEGLIILQGDRVVYKLEGGQPNILELEDKKNPLGPFQDLSISTDLGF